MSVVAGPWPRVPERTAVVARAAFPHGTLAMWVRDELPGLFTDEQFAAAFGVRGKPGISPGMLALVTVLQFVENLTDRQAADAVRGRIDWKYALGLELDDAGFDFSVLCGFRRRLLDHGLEEAMLDLLLARLVERGLVKARGRQRTDSTHVLAAVRSLHRLEFCAETLRAALEALAVAAPKWLATWITVEQQKRYGARVRVPGQPPDVLPPRIEPPFRDGGLAQVLVTRIPRERGAQAALGQAQPVVRGGVEVADPGPPGGIDDVRGRFVADRPEQVAELGGTETEGRHRQLTYAGRLRFAAHGVSISSRRPDSSRRPACSGRTAGPCDISMRDSFVLGASAAIAASSTWMPSPGVSPRT
jgi:transposase